MISAQKIPRSVQLNFEHRTTELSKRFEEIPEFMDTRVKFTESLANFKKYCSIAYADDEFALKVQSLLNYFDALIRTQKSVSGQDVFETIKSGFNTDNKVVKFTPHEQVGLLEFLYSERLSHLITNEKKLDLIAQEAIRDSAGSTWQKASINLAGLHCRGHNYDAMQATYPKNSQVLAIVCDGVSGEGRPKGEKNILLGRAVARFAVARFQELVSAHDLKKISTNELRDAFVNRTMVQLQNDIAEAFKENRLLGELKIDFSNPFTCLPATTFTAVLDFGNDIGLISIGDSHVFALNDEGLIENSINRHHVSRTKDDPQYRMDSALGLKCIDSKRVDLALVNISKTYHKKKDIKLVIASSDALFENFLVNQNRLHRNKVNALQLHRLNSSREVLAKLLEISKSHDDRTAQVLMREPPALEKILNRSFASIIARLNLD